MAKHTPWRDTIGPTGRPEVLQRLMGYDGVSLEMAGCVRTRGLTYRQIHRFYPKRIQSESKNLRRNTQQPKKTSVTSASRKKNVLRNRGRMKLLTSNYAFLHRHPTSVSSITRARRILIGKNIRELIASFGYLKGDFTPQRSGIQTKSILQIIFTF